MILHPEKAVKTGQQRWLTTAQMMERYSCSRSTLWRMERDGRIPKADRSRGNPRWFAAIVEESDRRALQATV